jgi:hypothetical protein
LRKEVFLEKLGTSMKNNYFYNNRYKLCFTSLLLHASVGMADSNIEQQLRNIQLKKQELVASLNSVNSTGENTLNIEDQFNKIQKEEPKKIIEFRQKLANLEIKTNNEIDSKYTKSVFDYTEKFNENFNSLTGQLNKEKSICENLTKSGPPVGNLNNQLSASDKKIDELRSQKSIVMAQLRTGLCCSECKRTKLELEAAGENFEAHLKRVGGTAIITQEDIKEKEKKYDEPINDELRTHSNIQNTISKVTTEFNNNFNSCTKKSSELDLQVKSLVNEKPLKLKDFLTEKESAIKTFQEEKTKTNTMIDQREVKVNDKLKDLKKTIEDKQSAYKSKKESLEKAIQETSKQEASMLEQVKVTTTQAMNKESQAVAENYKKDLGNYLKDGFVPSSPKVNYSPKVQEYIQKSNPVEFVRDNIKYNLNKSASEIKGEVSNYIQGNIIGKTDLNINKITNAVDNLFQDNSAQMIKDRIVTAYNEKLEQVIINAYVQKDKASTPSY